MRCGSTHDLDNCCRANLSCPCVSSLLKPAISHPPKEQGGTCISATLALQASVTASTSLVSLLSWRQLVNSSRRYAAFQKLPDSAALFNWAYSSREGRALKASGGMQE